MYKFKDEIDNIEIANESAQLYHKEKSGYMSNSRRGGIRRKLKT